MSYFVGPTFRLFRLIGWIFPKHKVNWVFLTGEVRAAGAHLAGAPYWAAPSLSAQRDTSADNDGAESPSLSAQRADPGVSAV